MKYKIKSLLLLLLLSLLACNQDASNSRKINYQHLVDEAVMKEIQEAEDYARIGNKGLASFTLQFGC